jgi:hypothetical protein
VKAVTRVSCIVLLALAVMGGTMVVGWLAPPVLGAASGIVLWRQRSLFLPALLGASLGWTLLLLGNSYLGEVGRLGAAAGAVIGLPGWGFASLTIVFAGLLAGCAARSTQWLRTSLRGVRSAGAGR